MRAETKGNYVRVISNIITDLSAMIFHVLLHVIRPNNKLV